eukprot:1196004-Prorocentrum_minimum.AAC.2
MLPNDYQKVTIKYHKITQKSPKNERNRLAKGLFAPLSPTYLRPGRVRGARACGRPGGFHPLPLP